MGCIAAILADGKSAPSLPFDLDARSCSAIGRPTTVRQALQAFVERTGADELMLTSQIFDHDARMRSYELTARASRAADAA